MIVLCSRCHSPVEITRRKFKDWTEKAGLPFTCDACLSGDIKRAVTASDIAKAEAITRAFQSINLNPNLHENPQNRTQQPRP